MTSTLDYAALVAQALQDGRPSGRWMRCTCPICPIKLGKVDRRRSLGVLVAERVYNCFRCGARGWLGDLPEGVSFPDAPVVDPAEAEEARRPPQGFWPVQDQASVLEPARAYLRSRGLPESLWHEAGIGACTEGFYAGRVVVPIRDDDGRSWLGWVGRAWTKKAQVPYLYPKGMPRGVVLYNHAALLLETMEPVLVVEGVFDALALWPHAVALLGKASPWQVNALAASPRPVAVVLDGDASDEGWALAMRLRLEGHRAGNVKLPPRMDPDEVDRGWLDREVEKCLDAR